MPTNAALRDLFLLQPDIVFLNHGAFGACPRPVFEVYQRWQRELEAQPVEFLGRRFADLMWTAREALAGYLHADPNDLVYVPNATTGLNVVARSLPLEPGDEILATDHEYGALDRTWSLVCSKRGVKYINHPVPVPVSSAKEVVETIWAGVTPRTRVLFLSHITSPTALTFPVAELARRARAAGILTVVDGAHAPGQIPLDLTALGVDFYAGNLHKWLCGPKGSAFLYARREVQHLLEPLVVSWGWHAEGSSLPEIYRAGQFSTFTLEQEWQGTRDIAAYLSIPAAIQFQAEHDWPRVRQGCYELVRYVRRRLTDLTGLEPICPDSAEWYVQMAALQLPACDVDELKRRLWDEYRVEVPLHTWNGLPLIRISVQGYNTQADLDVLLEALVRLLQLGGKGLA